VLVNDDGLWYPTMEPHSFEEEVGSIFHCDALLAICEGGHLRKLINYYKYTIISMLGGWKARHVIHRDEFPRPLGSRNMGLQAFLLDGRLGNDTRSAIYYIIVDVLYGFWEIKMFL
jgi:hypothetical protein